MKWFKKLFQRDSANRQQNQETRPRTRGFFNWFGSSNTATAEQDNDSIQLKDEIDVVPRTEITTSRQALDNISFALSNELGESSGVGSGIKSQEEKINKKCNNKYCCNVKSHSHNKNDDNQSITLFTIHEANENNESDSDYEINNERQIQQKIKQLNDEITAGKLKPFGEDGNENRESEDAEPEDLGFERYSPMYYSPNIDYKKFKYEYLSKLEYDLMKSKFSIARCLKFNYRSKLKDFRGNKRKLRWKFEDFMDDRCHRKMHVDTRIIKEYHRLDAHSNILLHLPPMKIHRPIGIEHFGKGIMETIRWHLVKSEEATEGYNVKRESKCTFIRRIKKWFRSE